MNYERKFEKIPCSLAKSNHKLLGRCGDILKNKFEGIEGPIDTQHLLISTLLHPGGKDVLWEYLSEVESARIYR